MIRVHVICEGQTEEAFVKSLLNPHFEAKNIYLNPILIGKSGGDVSFKRLKKDIIILLKDSSAFVTNVSYG
jgi:hypothetical protein